MRRLLAGFLMLLSLLCLLPSCGEKEIELPADFNQTVETLLDRSKTVNLLYYGGGMPTVGEASGGYFRADPLACEALGLFTVAEIKALTESVFTAAEVAYIYHEAGGEGEGKNFPAYKDSERGLLVSEACLNRTNGFSAEYHTDRLEILERESDRVHIRVPVTLTSPDLTLTQPRYFTGWVVLTEEGWRLNDATYFVYDTLQGDGEPLS